MEHFWSTLAIVKVGQVQKIISLFFKYKYYLGISKPTPCGQDGEVSQDFSTLEELNKFKMRKTFWWQVNEDHL